MTDAFVHVIIQSHSGAHSHCLQQYTAAKMTLCGQGATGFATSFCSRTASIHNEYGPILSCIFICSVPIDIQCSEFFIRPIKLSFSNGKPVILD